MLKIRCNACGALISPNNFNKHVNAHRGEHPCLGCGKYVSSSKKFCGLSCSNRVNANRKGTGKGGVKPDAKPEKSLTDILTDYSRLELNPSAMQEVGA